MNNIVITINMPEDGGSNTVVIADTMDGGQTAMEKRATNMVMSLVSSIMSGIEDHEKMYYAEGLNDEDFESCLSQVLASYLFSVAQSHNEDAENMTQTLHDSIVVWLSKIDEILAEE